MIGLDRAMTHEFVLACRQFHDHLITAQDFWAILTSPFHMNVGEDRLRMEWFKQIVLWCGGT